MRNGSLLNFMTTDCIVKNVAAKGLIEKNGLNLNELKSQNPKLGEVIVTEIDKKRIFNLFVGNAHNDQGKKCIYLLRCIEKPSVGNENHLNRPRKDRSATECIIFVTYISILKRTFLYR